MSDPKITSITGTNFPVSALEYLQKHAVSDGHPKTNAGVARYAVVTLARHLGWKPEDGNGQPESEKN